MKICKNCGRENQDSSDFCIYDGFELESEVVVVEDNIQEKIITSSKDNSKEEIIEDEIHDNTIIVKLVDNMDNELNRWKLGQYPSYSIGRLSSKGSVDIDVSKYEGGELVSRNHGKFYRKNDGWYYVDCDSSNGSAIKSKLKNEPCISNRDYKISQGDMIVLASEIKLVAV